MNLIDTHIHLDAPEFKDDLESLIQLAREEGITKMLIPNVDLSTAQRVKEVADSHPGCCVPMMGLHPTSVKDDFEKELKGIESLLTERSYCAIGEIGIDLYWDKTYYDQQILAFVWQMRWARDLKLPAVIHSRKSLEEIMQVIAKEHLEDIPAVFHCFPGSLEQGRRLVGMGYKLGIGGVVTFKNASLVEVVRNLPLESILLETDAPWLAPVPFRGKRNEPSYLKIIAQKIAEIKETTLEEVASVCSRNAVELFTLPVS